MRLILIYTALAASVAAPAGAVTYPQCIDMLHAMLGNQQAVAAAISTQLKTMNLSDPIMGKLADEAIKDKLSIDAAFKAYTDALGDACQAMR